MSHYELFADTIDGRLHVAVMQKGIVQNIYVDHADMSLSWSSIYCGKVTKIDTKLDAAIIDLGNGHSGFLSAKHVHTKDADSSQKRTGIADLVKPGEILLVQVKSEAKKGSLHENHKLPRLTTKVYLMGQYLAYGPNAHQVSISHKIKNDKTHQVASSLPGKGAWIVHTTSDKVEEDALRHEATSLLTKWEKIEASAKSADMPRLISPGLNALERALCDYGTPDLEHLYVGNKDILDLAMKWSQIHAPALAASKRLRLHKPEPTAQHLFDLHDIYTAIEDTRSPRINLPSGGSVVLEQTHAMIVADVNQGNASAAAGANREAATEIARHIRLRNLSGAILIDFIDTGQKSDRADVLDILEKALASDRAQAQVHGFTRLGIVEITRKRRSATLAEKFS